MSGWGNQLREARERMRVTVTEAADGALEAEGDKADALLRDELI